MTLTAPLLLSALLAGLSAIVALELRPRVVDEGPMPASPTPVQSLSPAAMPAAGPDHADAWVRTILARPLFAPDRRPPADAPAAAASGPPPLPRVAGILIDGRNRSVIFAGPAGGRPVVVPEGGMVNGFRVQTIDTGQVVLLGPGGPRTLRPSFDPQAPAAPPAPSQAPPQATGLPGLPGLSGLTGIPGLPPLGAPPGPSPR